MIDLLTGVGALLGFFGFCWFIGWVLDRDSYASPGEMLAGGVFVVLFTALLLGGFLLVSLVLGGLIRGTF